MSDKMSGSESARIGFVGLGNMGAPMAGHLARAGHGLVLYDARRAAAEALASETVQVAESPRALGAACGVVITMLPDSEVVRAVVLGAGGDDGLVHGLASGATVIDMSSSAPAATRDLGQVLVARGMALVDAPVSGGVPRAKDGTLTIMAGGASDVLDRVEPLLSPMGTVRRTGPLGSGHAAKALNNYVNAAGFIAVCEALIVAKHFGVDPQVLNAVLKTSTGRNNTTDNKVEQFMLNRAFDSGFALALMRKDVGIARDLAAGLELDASWVEGCAALLDAASEALGPEADYTEAFAYLERRLGGEGGEMPQD